MTKYNLTVEDTRTWAHVSLYYHHDLDRDTRADLMCGITQPDRALFQSHYVDMGMKVVKDDADDLAVCERMFELTNSPAPSDGGAFVEQVGGMARFWGSHTSLSVGDVVVITRHGKGTRYYLCASCGFTEITKALSK